MTASLCEFGSRFAIAQVQLGVPFLSPINTTGQTIGYSKTSVSTGSLVAEMPGSNGVILKIAHFDEVAGATHVEL